jgi:hypothetical protein
VAPGNSFGCYCVYIPHLLPVYNHHRVYRVECVIDLHQPEKKKPTRSSSRLLFSCFPSKRVATHIRREVSNVRLSLDTPSATCNIQPDGAHVDAAVAGWGAHDGAVVRCLWNTAELWTRTCSGWSAKTEKHRLITNAWRQNWYRRSCCSCVYMLCCRVFFLFSFCCCVISLLLLYFSSRQSLHNTGVLGFVLLFGCSLFLDGPRLLFIIGRQLQLCRSGESIWAD